MVRSERHACWDGSKADVDEVNSEHRRNPKKARRNMDSRVASVKGDEYPERRVLMQRVRRSEVSGSRFGGSLGSAFRRPLNSILM